MKNKVSGLFRPLITLFSEIMVFYVVYFIDIYNYCDIITYINSDVYIQINKKLSFKLN